MTSSSVFGAWNRIFVEDFCPESGRGPYAAKGYLENWTEAVSGGAVLDPNYAVSGLTNPPDDWGDECLRMYNPDSGTDLCDIYTTVGDQAIVYIRDEIYIKSEGLENGENTILQWAETSGAAEVWELRLEQAGGNLRLHIKVIRGDLGALRYSSGDYADLQLNTQYRIEVYYNETSDVWAWRVNGVDQDNGTGTLSGPHPPKVFNSIYLDNDYSPSGDPSIELFRDNFAVDTSDWCDAREGLTFYVDNEHGGSNAGTQANPFKSIADLDASTDLVWETYPHTVYIKATNTPYRESLDGSDDYWHQTIYCDWTGSGTVRGNGKAKFYGSEAVSTWSVYNGNTYQATHAESGSSPLKTAALGDVGCWYLKSGTVTPLTLVVDKDSCGSNQYFHDNVGDILYVNVGEDPDLGQIEAMDRHSAMEIYGQESVYSATFQFADYGNANGNCSEWHIENCDFIWNSEHGFSTGGRENDYDSADWLLTKCRMSNNGENGIYYGGGLNLDEIQGVIQLCQIDNNGDDGIHLYAGMLDAGDNFIKLYNNTIYGNGDEGVYALNGGAGADQKMKVICKNTISQDNTGHEFEGNNHANVEITADYNCVGGGTYDGVKWTAGANDVASDSLLAEDFTLSSGSPCVDSGTDVGLTEDYNGITLPQGEGYDIGMFEYMISDGWGKGMLDDFMWSDTIWGR